MEKCGAEMANQHHQRRYSFRKKDILKVFVVGSSGIMVVLLIMIIISGKSLFSGNTLTNPRDESIMVCIHGGEFMMGRDTREENRPGHPVSV